MMAATTPPLLCLVVGRAVEQGFDLGVGGEDVELTDGHVVQWFLRHVSSLVPTSQVVLASNRFKKPSNRFMSLRGGP
jgi:hypothetical protein